MNQTIIYKTTMPEIDVIVTNVVGIQHLNGQYFVFEVDTEENQCTGHYGPFSNLADAQVRAFQSCEEIRHVTTATIPDDFGF